MFDPNANPEPVAARAAELAIEQLDRLNNVLKRTDNSQEAAIKFYSEPFEVGISNRIAKLLGGYAVLKGYVPENRFADR